MNDPTPAPATTPANPAAAPASAPPARPSRGPGTLQLGIVVAILAVGIILTALTSDVTRVSEPGIRLVDDRPFLPETAGDWKGSPQTGLTPEEKAALPADTDGVRRLYTDPNGRTVYCSVVLAGRDVTSIHRPELCLTGQGWKLDPAKTEHIPVPAAAGGVIDVSRMNAVNTVPTPGGSSQANAVFVYWFVGKDRMTPYHWQRILWTTEDRVLHNRNHRWAYFLISVISSSQRAEHDPKGADEDSMQLARKFIQDVYPKLAPN
jgi:EpsI family protein